MIIIIHRHFLVKTKEWLTELNCDGTLVILGLAENSKVLRSFHHLSLHSMLRHL